MSYSKPLYIESYNNGSLQQKIEKAYALIQKCSLCPRNCGVNRLKDQKGYCQTGKHAMISSCQPHFGEEDVLVEKHGSGTIFFTPFTDKKVITCFDFFTYCKA